MINKTYIERDLNRFNNLYTKTSDVRLTFFYSKMAILELCGWIEESMDDIIHGCAQRHLREPENIRLVEGSIKRTHSFEYYQNFRNMLIQVIGLVNIEELESGLNATNFDLMKSALSSLKECRDKQAHTHLGKTALSIDAPSITQGRFQNTYRGLKDIESYLRSMSL